MMPNLDSSIKDLVEDSLIEYLESVDRSRLPQAFTITVPNAYLKFLGKRYGFKVNVLGYQITVLACD